MTHPVVLHQPLGLCHHLRYLYVPRCRLIEGRADYLAVYGPLHICNFPTLVDQQDDQNHLRMILRDGVCDRLQQHGLPVRGGETIKPRCPADKPSSP